MSSKTINRLRRLRRPVLCAVGLSPVFLAIHLAAHWFRFGLEPLAAASNQFAATLVIVLLLKLTMFGWFRVFQGWSRYVTFHDLVTLGKATTATSLLLVLG